MIDELNTESSLYNKLFTVFYIVFLEEKHGCQQEQIFYIVLMILLTGYLGGEKCYDMSACTLDHTITKAPNMLEGVGVVGSNTGNQNKDTVKCNL